MIPAAGVAFCVWAGVACLLVLLLILGWLRSGYERSHLVTDCYELYTDKLGRDFDGYTIGVLADLHGNELGKDHKDLLDALDRAAPDMILIAGDMITARENKPVDTASLEVLLRSIQKKYPVYYGNGNHEQRMMGRQEFHEWLEGLGICHLQDQILVASEKPGGGKIFVGSVDIDQKYYRKKGKPLVMEPEYLTERLGVSQEQGFQLLIAHNPLFFDAYAAWGADLTVSGHFHGGTIRIPYFGGVMTPQYQFFYPHTRGLYLKRRKDGSQAAMAVTGGLGTHSINIRLNNPSQLLVIRLKTDKG